MTTKIVHWCCRIFLGVIFIYAAYTKIENPLQFAAAIEAYKLLPPGIVIWVVKILPWLELALGAAILVGPLVRFTAASMASFLAFFITVMLITYLRGIEADCGCFGVGERISPLTLIRDTSFMLPALFLFAQPWIEERGWLPRRIR
jgi:uncharacterized membrane protein YphA (DoxX/SURF4 family)